MRNYNLNEIYNLVLENEIDVESICEQAFMDTFECICVRKGTDNYFDTYQMQWYPGDPDEYEVDGYDDYIEQVVDNIIDGIHGGLGLPIQNGLREFVKSNLSYICDGYLLDDDDYYTAAMEQ